MNSFDKLRGHPARCAYSSLTRKVLLCKLDRVPKVSQSDITIKINENIIALDVSVDHVPLVQEFQAF